MKDDYIIIDGELYHYGRKGMKWGQHIFGKVKEDIGRRMARRKELKERERLTKTPLRKLTSEEIKRRSELLDEEKMIRQKERDIKNLNPEQVAVGKKFVINVGQKVLGPALADAGRDVLTKFLKDKFGKMMGLSDKEVDDAMDALAKEAKRWGYEKTIAEGKTAKNKLDKENANPGNTSKPNPDSASKPNADNTSKHNTDNASKSNDGNTSKPNSSTTRNDDRVYEGEVVDGPASSSGAKKKKNKKKKSKPRDTTTLDPSQYTVSDVTDIAVVNNGESFIRKFLEGNNK